MTEEAITGQLFIWSAGQGGWVECPPEEITWLDRELLSGANHDFTLHRAPRCAGLRYVHHQWELFSRDTTHEVYLTRHVKGITTDHLLVRIGAVDVLPVAPIQHYETLPLVLEEGAWLICVGTHVLQVRVIYSSQQRPHDASTHDDEPSTQDETPTNAFLRARRIRPRSDAPARVRAYLNRNATARSAMALHYQEFILGLTGPQPIPMTQVAIALNLSSEGTISDYKKALQSLIWKERGHPRELAEFLVANGLLTKDDLITANRLASENAHNGVSKLAKTRMQYRTKRQHGEESAG